MTMEDKLTENLNRAFVGKPARDADWDELMKEELLESTGLDEEEDEEEYEEDEEYEPSTSMVMSIEISTGEDDDGNTIIDEIIIGFQTYSDYDSGLGEEDPEWYFTYEQCYAAAEEFIRNVLVEE